MNETNVKERGILMHARSVNNILAGRKTQTRRIIKPQPEGGVPVRRGYLHGEGWGWFFDNCESFLPDKKCPYGQPGDRLWVRETWAVHFMYDDLPPSRIRPPADMAEPSLSKWGCHRTGDAVWYLATGNNIPEPDNGCRSGHRGRTRASLHMPRWASRITLEIVAVRVERVQDASHDDIQAEGVRCEYSDQSPAYCTQCGGHEPICLREKWKALWDDTNGKGAWDRNDWVWAIEFKVIDGEKA